MITFPGIPQWLMWAGFLVLVVIMLWIDLGAFNKKDHVVGIRESLLWTAFWIALSLVFCGLIYLQFGTEIALEYLTGYLMEKSLSMDNLFVFLMIFTAFNIPRIYQHRVLFWGIVGAVVLRGVFIIAGAALVQEFTWVFLIFALIVLWGAYKMQFQKEKKFDPDKSYAVKISKWFFPITKRIRGHKFFLKENGKWHATILFVALVTIELTDVVFATDSIPAIFAITTDPFIVFTSNIFAILGLRALYFAIAGLHAMFVYLKTGLAAILAFVGIKMVLIGVPSVAEIFGVHLPHYHIPIGVSLLVIGGIILASILASVILTKEHGKPRRRHPEHGIEKKGNALRLGITTKDWKMWK